MKIDLLVKFSVTKEISPDSALEKVKDILVADETIELAYTHKRDKV
mgnify:CR=1 FL=1|tara:strand:+ start:892 stop:1029 length:138 start_codon:yes stop_codon:yes gene_type:complete